MKQEIDKFELLSKNKSIVMNENDLGGQKPNSGGNDEEKMNLIKNASQGASLSLSQKKKLESYKVGTNTPSPSD